jgi:hypothetical protein
MPQQQMGYGGGFGGQMQGFGGGYGMPQRRPMYGGDTPMAPQQPQQPQQPTPEPAGYGAMMDSYRQQANQMMAAQNAAERSMGMPTYDANTDPLRGIGINIAQPPRPMTQPMAPQQAGSDAARLYEQFQSAQGMGKGRPGIDYPMVSQREPVRDYDRPQVSQREPVRDYDRPQMPANPYAQQTRQEDPRMQAMRMMQRMRFGGGGGYDF